MKVMFVCTTGGAGRRQLGGAERFLVEMLPALAGHGIDVVACTPDDAVGAGLRAAGVTWIELGARRRIDLGYVREIRRLTAELRPDVVSAHLLSAAMHARAALRGSRRGTGLVVALHNSLWQYRDAAPSMRAKAAVQANISLDLTMRRVRPHVTVAVSDFEAEELRVRGRVGDVHVIPNPLPATWPAVDGSTGTPPPRLARVGFLGRLEPEKGADLIPAIATALPQAEFLVAGAGSTPVPPLPNVRLVGRVDAASFLRDLHCLLVPSRVESFGRSALEAMSLGVPVVHSGAGGLAELTRRGDGVLAYRADLTPAGLAAAVAKATNGNDDTISAARHELARWYAQEYSFDRCVEQWLGLYRSVAHDTR
jgi:glycosyltransferase involved in cell wall biosynthesis